MSWDAKGKVVLITGGSRGLGEFLCKYFAESGAIIVLISRNEKRLTILKKEIMERGGQIDCHVMDVRDYCGLLEIAKEVKKKYKKIDVLINNAGVGIFSKFEELSKDNIDDVIDTNLKGAIYSTRVFAPIMMSNKSGSIINISSITSTRGKKGNGIYAASKFGLNGFADSISKYLIDYGIKVITLRPGSINTTWWEDKSWGRKNQNDNLMTSPVEIAKLITHMLGCERNTLYKSIDFVSTFEVDAW